jgi:hypothetical protein
MIDVSLDLGRIPVAKHSGSATPEAHLMLFLAEKYVSSPQTV